jgi:hypothetical protein
MAKSEIGKSVIRGRKNAKKGFDRSVDRAVELGLDFCFQQNVYRGWGGARSAPIARNPTPAGQRRPGLGTPESPRSRDIAVIGKPGINHKGHEGTGAEGLRRFRSFGSRLPTPASEERACRGPRIAPLAHDDSLRRGGHCAARLYKARRKA